MDLQQKLKERGWFLTEEGLKKLPEDVDKTDVRHVIKAAMDIDFREIAGGALPTEIFKKDETIPGQVVLQIVKIRNISAPKSNEDSKAAPRFLQIELTDGINQVLALELEYIQSLSLNTPPGTKIYFKNDKIPLMHGLLVLRPNDIDILGGKVPALIEKWEIARTLQKYAKGGRLMTGSSGPPPWIPFGQKIQQNFGGNDKNFKSLGSEKDKEGKENNEFEAMRSEAIAEAAKIGGKKIFGGGNQQILDHNVKKIIERGFTEDDAKNALKATRNNLERALYNLKRREDYKDDFKDKSRNTLPKRGIKDSKKSKDDMIVPTKPVGNVSLFDFLTDKLPITSETPSEKPSMRSERPSKSSTESSKPFYNSQSSSHQSNQHQSQPNQYQQQHQQHSQSHNQQEQQMNIPNQATNNNNNNSRPKFENNISSSFANRSSGGPSDNDKGKYKSMRMNERGGSSGPNSYSSNRQDDGGDRYKDNQRNNSYSRNQRTQQDKNSPYQSGQHSQNSSSGGYDSRNRNENQQKNGYEKSGKGPSGPPRYPLKSDSNSYQQNNRNYNDNRQSSYNNDTSKMNKIVEETSKMKIDSKSRSSIHSSRNQSNISVSQHQIQHHHSVTSSSQQQQPQQQQQSQQQQQQQPPPSQSHHQSHGGNIPHKTYTQLPNGFAFDPSKIMGFQNKETNEFAMTMLKNQAMSTTMPPQQGSNVAAHPQYPPPPMQISQHPGFPTAQFVMQQAPAPQSTGGYGMNPGESWNWKVGDRCLAKYWDDGRYYEAEITALSDRTCVVLYIGYGNHEEVLKSDCLPITDAQHRAINFTKMHESHAQQQQQQQQQPPPSQQQQTVNRGVSNRYRGERQMYVPPPKREA